MALLTVRASSIIEVIVAMIILIIVFFISFKTFLTVQSKSSNLGLFKLKSEIPWVIEQIKNKKIPKSPMPEFTLLYDLSNYGGLNDLKEINISFVRSDGKTVLSHQELWFTPEK